MKNYLFILILASVFSCKKNPVSVQEKKSEKIERKEKMDDEIQEIGNLYQPEKIETKEIETKNVGEKNNYEITLTNSDLLDSDLKNKEKYAEKIGGNYYKFLIRINKPFDCNKIIVKIIHRNDKVDSFEYSEKQMLKILEKNKN